jgi:thermosome
MVAAAPSGAIPVIVLKEGSQRVRGREAQRNNITAAKLVSELIRTTLGPRGMDKMLVTSLGDVTITNDGASIMKDLDVQHPAAKMMVEVAKAQDNEVGDGTTTAVVLAGELLAKAEKLLDQGIHPSVIVEGYKKAAEKALEELEKIALTVEPEDTEKLKHIAVTAMRSKGVSVARDHLAALAVEAIRQIAEVRDGRWKADVDLVKVLKKHGKSLLESELVKGVVVDKEVAHPQMPKRVENARIALLNQKLEIEKTEMSAEIRINTPEQMKQFLDEETKILREMVEKIAASGANVLFCEKGIDDIALHYLARKGILGVKNVSSSDMEKLSKATGAKIVNNIDDLTADFLGAARVVEEVKIGDSKLVYVRECQNPRAVTVVLRGGSEHVVSEAERTFHDALCVVRNAVEDRKFVAGGGAPESELASRLREYAAQVGGREQLAIEAYAAALESIPETLAENAGYDPIDITTELRSKHADKGGVWYGVDVFTGRVTDMLKLNVLEPLRVKVNVIKSATEAASMILRIDDVVIAKAFKEEKKEKGKGAAGEGGEGEGEKPPGGEFEY